MPTVDEALQDRQTYGNAPGWAQERQTTIPPVPRNQAAPLAQEEAPPASDAAAAPSAEVVVEAPSQEQVSEEGTPSTTQPEPAKTWNAPPQERWEARQQELERERAARAEAERQNRLLLETIQRVAPQPQSIQAPDFWAGRIDHPDPATAQYWQGQKQMFEMAAEQGKQRAIAELQPVIQAGMRKFAAQDTETFRKENPDIQPGSAEESLVIAYMNGSVDGVSHPIKSARNNAVIQRLEAENRALKAKQAGMPQKRAAAQVEAGAGIPAGAGLPGRMSSAQERAGAVIDRGGSHLDAAKAFFGWK